MYWGHMAAGGWLLVAAFWFVPVAVVVFTAIRLPGGRRDAGDGEDAGILALIERLTFDEMTAEESHEPLGHSN